MFSLNNENKLHVSNTYAELIFLSPSLEISIYLKRRLIASIMHRMLLNNLLLFERKSHFNGSVVSEIS
jgi:hypothetical protein